MVDYRDVVKAAGFDPQSKAEWRDLMRQTHGDIEDGKVKFLFIAEEEGFDVDTDDIEAITDEPPTETFQ